MALGIAGGVSLAVGLASLPFPGGATVIQSLIWALRGGPAAMASTCFGAALAATSLLFCHSHFRRRLDRMAVQMRADEEQVERVIGKARNWWRS